MTEPDIAWARRAFFGTACGASVALVMAIPPVRREVVIVAIWVTVVALARTSGRTAAMFCGLFGGLFFGYAHTEPRFRFIIEGQRDVALTLMTIGVGLSLALLASMRSARDD